MVGGYEKISLGCLKEDSTTQLRGNSITTANTANPPYLPAVLTRVLVFTPCTSSDHSSSLTLPQNAQIYDGQSYIQNKHERCDRRGKTRIQHLEALAIDGQ